MADHGRHRWRDLVVCPIGGPACGRVRARLDAEWLADVMDVHLRLHHTPWR